MNREKSIEKIIIRLNQLPLNRVQQVDDFVACISKNHEEDTLNNGIEKLIEQSDVFQFLQREEDLYSIQDIVEKY